jgi:hypothetical protein
VFTGAAGVLRALGGGLRGAGRAGVTAIGWGGVARGVSSGSRDDLNGV